MWLLLAGQGAIPLGSGNHELDDQHFIGLQLVILAGGILLGLIIGLLATKIVGHLPIRLPAPSARGHWLLRELW